MHRPYCLRFAGWLMGVVFFSAPAFSQSLDHYTLVMGFLPGKCLVKPDLPLCHGLTIKAPAARNLTLIGLYPEARADSVPLKDCDPLASAFSTPLFAGEVDDIATRSCQLPEVKLSSTLSQALQDIMPGTAICAERQLWSQHGACSMLSQENYFRRAVNRAKDLQHSLLNVTLASAIGQRVKRDDMMNVFAAQFGETATQSALQFVCGRSKERHVAVLTEIRVKMRQLGTMKPLNAEGLWQETGKVMRQRCPEEFWVPEAGQPAPTSAMKPEKPGTMPTIQMPVVPSPKAPDLAAPDIIVPEIKAPQQPDPTKPQPMETEPVQIIEPSSE